MHLTLYVSTGIHGRALYCLEALSAFSPDELQANASSVSNSSRVNLKQSSVWFEKIFNIEVVNKNRPRF
jgi:hypothetical protein